MALLGRHRLPAEAHAGLRDHLGATAGRSVRVLAWCPSADGVVVALPDRLAFAAGSSWTSVPWEQMLSATWSDDGTTFAWRTVDHPYQLRSLTVSRPTSLPGVVRERLERTIVTRTEVQLAPGIVVTLLGRRPAVGAAEISWSVLPSKGVRLDTPELQAAADAAVQRARRDLI